MNKIFTGAFVGTALSLSLMTGVNASTILVDTTTFDDGRNLNQGINPYSDLVDYGRNGRNKNNADISTLNNEPTETIDDSGNTQGNGNADYLSWTHNFSFDPALVAINSAFLDITFERVNPNDLHTWAYIQFEGSQWTLLDISGGPIRFDVPNSLLLDNKYNIHISIDPTIISNDLFTETSGLTVHKSELTINYNSVNDNPVPTPEPATLILFGTGIAGLAAARRKKKVS